ncbi:acetate--CoA ligase family protein [Amycolatopsis sp. K13G38]|uniref:Acetate--CoA ligase family protein n=1 Tax=Amycolatopsis acididurans TaxID=2724524 RepID=A0ABX1IWD6_9PSEU|nr:acetate--CoA ligase family protein [Amycolatopsis acididurans]NKQ51778.1 acetate--CoA ligase family protein [Amycolatopsis acididurans]
MTERNAPAALMWPGSVALVGASDDPAKTNSRPLRYLRAAGFQGRVYPVNPRRDTVGGERCWPSLAELPEVPDHVYVMTSTEAAIETVAECGRLGVPVATVLASGFGEEGEEGREREARLRAAAGSTRILGPSSLGAINPRSGMLLTANAAFAEADLAPGRVFVASHSGSVIGALVSRGKERGISFAGLVSTGGEADLSLGEICLSTVDDDGIGSYALFMESLQHSDQLARFASAAAERGKPVVVYKLGRSAQGAQLSVSHTGALAGSDEEADAFFRAAAISRVDNLEALIEAPALLERVAPGKGAADFRVGVLTTTGGGAALIVDQLGLRGVHVRAPSAPLRKRIQDLGAPITDSIVMDLTLAGAKHEIVSGTLDALQRSGEFDVVVMVVGSSARFHPELAVRAVIERADGPTPLAAFAVPDAPKALAALGEAGVPAFRTPESIVEAITAAATRPASARIGPGTRPGTDGERRVLDELDSYRLLDKVGIAAQPAVEVVTAEAAQGRVPDGIRYPVAVKVLSAAIAHKTDAGGVVLGVAGDEQLVAAAREIEERVGPAADRLLVTEMAPSGVDALVGYRVSPEAGPLIMVAAGGVMAELYRDSSLRLAPVDLVTAHEMIREVKGLAPVVGYRGSQGDADALARAIVALSTLAESAPSVLEAEVNPLRVYGRGEGATALDALVCVTENN